MSDNDETPADESPASIGIANSRSKRERGKKVTGRLNALAALKAARDSGKKHLAEVDDIKVSVFNYKMFIFKSLKSIFLFVRKLLSTYRCDNCFECEGSNLSKLFHSR